MVHDCTHEEDQRVIRAAHAFEAQAEALVNLPRGDLVERTRGPYQMRLRQSATGEAARLLAEADALYWDRVQAHEGAIQMLARFYAGSLGVDIMADYARTGFLEGAMRWDPDRGVRLPTYARSYVQRARGYALKAEQPGRAYASLFDDDGAEERFAAELVDVEPALDRDTLSSALAQLTEQESTIVRAHTVDGLTFQQIADMNGITRQRNHQIYQTALGKLRNALRVA